MPGWHMVPRTMSPREETRLRQQAIGWKLRQHFDPIIYLPVPREWLDLLRQADARAAQAVRLAS